MFLPDHSIQNNPDLWIDDLGNLSLRKIYDFNLVFSQCTLAARAHTAPEIFISGGTQLTTGFSLDGLIEQSASALIIMPDLKHVKADTSSLKWNPKEELSRLLTSVQRNRKETNVFCTEQRKPVASCCLMTVLAFPTLPKIVTCRFSSLPFFLRQRLWLSTSFLTHPGYWQGTMSFAFKDQESPLFLNVYTEYFCWDFTRNGC